MYKILILSIVLFGLALGSVFSANIPRNGTEEIFSNLTHIFTNQDCVDSGTCDLKEFWLKVKKARMWVVDGWHYGSDAVIAYETDFVENLENYSIVQFIRGCMFASSQVTDGDIEKIFGFSKPQFSDFDEDDQLVNSKTFCFPSWVIDSIDKDPVYASFPGLGRFDARRWNMVLGSYDKKTEKYYGDEKPAYPALYMRDVPSGAFLGELNAINASMEFKTCIYKTKDVPLETTEDDINFATPIKCFEWQNIYIYNHEIKEFEMKFEIDEFCLAKPSN